MKGFFAHLALSWRLHLRNRMALLYGYLFPLIFLAVFWVLYRHDPVPLLRHLGELLTVTVLGGACFGLPTTIVSERERGVWRRYRLTPVRTSTLIASTVVARFLIIASAGVLQFAVARAVGMTAPQHPWLLVAAYVVTTFAFIGLGLLLAMLADNVPAVQALGQCVFLPMLVIGGVAVPLTSLPAWAQQLAAFFPGRYAVDSLQAATTGTDLTALPFNLLALALTGIAGAVAAAKLFRWDAQQRFFARTGKVWLVAIVAGWLATGALARWHDAANAESAAVRALATAPVGGDGSAVTSWEAITARDVSSLDYQLPPDNGVVAPIAAPGVQPDEMTAAVLEQLRAELPDWSPGASGPDVQRVRYLLCVAAVPDLAQDPAERFVPVIVYQYLTALYPKPQLIRMLTWIALHPEGGAVLGNLSSLGFAARTSDSAQVRERSYFYAVKFVARLTGRTKPQLPP